MRNTFKLIISVIIFSFFLTNIVLANERFCLDKGGLILPIFDGSECINSSDIEIDKDEFSFIIKHEASQRLVKLNDFRKNKEKILKASSQGTLIAGSEKKQQDEELEKKRIAEDQKNKRLKEKKELESKKAERLAKIEKRK